MEIITTLYALNRQQLLVKVVTEEEAKLVSGRVDTVYRCTGLEQLQLTNVISKR